MDFLFGQNQYERTRQQLGIELHHPQLIKNVQLPIPPESHPNLTSIDLNIWRSYVEDKELQTFLAQLPKLQTCAIRTGPELSIPNEIYDTKYQQLLRLPNRWPATLQKLLIHGTSDWTPPTLPPGSLLPRAERLFIAGAAVNKLPPKAMTSSTTRRQKTRWTNQQHELNELERSLWHPGALIPEANLKANAVQQLQDFFNV